MFNNFKTSWLFQFGANSVAGPLAAPLSGLRLICWGDNIIGTVWNRSICVATDRHRLTRQSLCQIGGIAGLSVTPESQTSESRSWGVSLFRQSSLFSTVQCTLSIQCSYTGSIHALEECSRVDLAHGAVYRAYKPCHTDGFCKAKILLSKLLSGLLSKHCLQFRS